MPSAKELSGQKIAAPHRSTNSSPFARFQLFRNPFGELTVAERAALAVVDVDKYLHWLAQSPRAAVQVIGPCGHGKSTHLRALQYAWAGRHASDSLPAFVYFPEEGDQPALPCSRPLFIDEAQRMHWWRRRQMLRGDGPLVIGTHRDMSRELTRVGFQLLTIDLDHTLSPTCLQAMLNRRIAASRLGMIETGGTVTFSDTGANDCGTGHKTRPDPIFVNIAQVVALQERFGSNVRQIEEYLYERFQRFALKGEPWLPVE